MNIHPTIIGREVSFFHATAPHEKLVLIRGIVKSHLGDGIVLQGVAEPFWFADMMAPRKH